MKFEKKTRCEIFRKTTLRHLIYIAIIGLLCSCSIDGKNKNVTQKTLNNSNDRNLSLQTTTERLQANADETQLTKTMDSSYCYIKDVVNQNNQTFLQVDFIQFFTFEQAIEEAKKRGEAEYKIKANGDTTYFVYNDYYIANDNPKLRTFKLTDSTKFKFLEEHGGAAINFKDTKTAMKRVEFSPFIIKTKQGNVISLTEIYTP